MTKGLRVGYIRVSTIDQNPDRQLAGIELDKKYIDYAGGKNLQRKEFESMMQFVREGDCVIVHSIDRIARNLMSLRQLVIELNKKGVTIQFIKENLKFEPNTTDHLATLMLSMMGAFAEFELSIIKERQLEGIAIARAKNDWKTQKKLTKTQEEEIGLLIEQHVPVAELANRYKVSRPTIYKCRRPKDAQKEA